MAESSFLAIIHSPSVAANNGPSIGCEKAIAFLCKTEKKFRLEGHSSYLRVNYFQSEILSTVIGKDKIEHQVFSGVLSHLTPGTLPTQNVTSW